ncbi:MAG TPA: hypothetical protein VD789_05940 [Thermomicrobiales bacterium]|nr:hypothetical protein [Thermomicrobiales bacterium]
MPTSPSNEEHFSRLMAFTREVLRACDEAGVAPILDGGLAVFAYTREPGLEVRDVDFGCPESDLPRLQDALQRRGIHAEIRSWHVLQARRDDLKVEFGAVEHWNRGIPDHHERIRIAGIEFRVINVDGLREQYRRGVANTAEGAVDSDPVKHRASSEKLRLLDAMGAP